MIDPLVLSYRSCSKMQTAEFNSNDYRDHKTTAVAIAKEIGIMEDEAAITELSSRK